MLFCYTILIWIINVKTVEISSLSRYSINIYELWQYPTKRFISEAIRSGSEHLIFPSFPEGVLTN